MLKITKSSTEIVDCALSLTLSEKIGLQFYLPLEHMSLMRSHFISQLCKMQHKLIKNKTV